MKPLKNKVSITLDADIIDEIKHLAEEDDRSFSQYINLILKEYLQTPINTNKEAQLTMLLYHIEIFSFCGMPTAYIYKNIISKISAIKTANIIKTK